MQKASGKDVTGKDLDWGVLLAVDGVVFVLGILVEQVTLVIAGRRKRLSMKRRIDVWS